MICVPVVNISYKKIIYSGGASINDDVVVSRAYSYDVVQQV